MTITDELIQNKHLGAPLSGGTCLAAIHSDLTNSLSSAEAFNCLAVANMLHARSCMVLQCPPLESITCQATIHSYLTKLVYITFLLAGK